MNLGAATSLTAWLWSQHPELVYALARQVPAGLGQCITCDVALFVPSASCDIGNFTSLSCSSLSLDTSTLGPENLDVPQLSCDGSSLDSLGIDPGVCIPTLTESDLTPVPTCAVTISGGTPCVPNVCTSVTSTDVATGNALSGVAKFLTSAIGLTALTNAAGAYFKAQAAGSVAQAAAANAQAAVVNAQTARAVVGKTALPITYVANGASGTITPMISTTGGLLPVTSSTLSSLTPNSIQVFFAQYGTWLVVGGAGLFLLYAATRRKGAP